MQSILVRVYRGNTVESIHYGSVAVVDSVGKLVYSFGDPYFVTYLRSSAKPFQVIPLITSGAAKKFGLSQKEIAIISGSHNGQKIHTDTVKSILKKIGLSEKNLQCGVHILHNILLITKFLLRIKNLPRSITIALESMPGCWVCVSTSDGTSRIIVTRTIQSRR